MEKSQHVLYWVRFSSSDITVCVVLRVACPSAHRAPPVLTADQATTCDIGRWGSGFAVL